ncbi:MAG TPA: hypothetical protein VJ276_03150 [Thermoanaerobaculia bacterium]|nr:hypothetical protein [Thermoanaerobaculia bacterium]
MKIRDSSYRVTREPLSELYYECAVALELYRFTHKAYSNLIDHCPPVVHDLLTYLMAYIYEDLQQTLREFLTSEDAYDLAQLLNEILASKPEILE